MFLKVDLLGKLSHCNGNIYPFVELDSKSNSKKTYKEYSATSFAKINCKHLCMLDSEADTRGVL